MPSYRFTAIANVVDVVRPERVPYEALEARPALAGVAF